ncbi:MAG: hypothetical protein GC171_09300 [Terrimonas sp.]|nr:hypothetical protein [Terrimonas sp.]
MEKELFLGNCKLKTEGNSIAGEFMEINGESFYKISAYDRMDPFFMTIVSNTDHWMFISSNGALTAGRKSPDHALFPYYTVDKIQDAPEVSGSKSIFQVLRNNQWILWEPFSDHYQGVYNIQRNIYKSIYSNKVIFEEINHDLELSFSYQWMNSDRFGFIRQAELTSHAAIPSKIIVVDGIQNILPSGIDRLLQQSYSNLVDAYKKSELIPEYRIGLFMLSSVIVDKAEPSEALTANLVWSEGLENPEILLSSRQLNAFRKGHPAVTETDVRATRGAYFVQAEIDLQPGQSKKWHLVAEVNIDAGYIASLKQILQDNPDLAGTLMEDVKDNTNDLVRILASADGLQLTADKLSENRHLSNVLFNVMRGGIFDDNYTIFKQDFLQFVGNANKAVAEANRSLLAALPDAIPYTELIQKAEDNGDAQLLRLCYEYLPLSFSRRHGDPSRPWNLFSVEMKKEDGSKNLFYQGNWRDIFQNWEALSLSYPSFVESMISKFLNASTADGYNPYRITRDGIDWEAPDPHDPWANIGYWGDHQVIYLQKFLEISNRYHPGALQKMLTQNIFSYANVPYRIKPYPALVKNPFDTIEYDYAAAKDTAARVQQTGSDGKLVFDKDNKVLQVNFTEKLLATVLAKLSNFIPEAGIWLNTQRPEWNDANNALVGNGVSMVTLYYLRRMLSFCKVLFEQATAKEVKVSAEIGEFYQSVAITFSQHLHLLGQAISDKDRKKITDALGMAGSAYRERIYQSGFSGEMINLQTSDIAAFLGISLQYIDHSIRNNKREDNLYHSYNLVTIGEDSITVRHLYEMLEGQVAVLSSGLLGPQEVNDVLDALKWSAMFRRDQYSYMLYPDRQLPRFTEKNIIPPALVKENDLLNRLLEDHNRDILYQDVEGAYHFNSRFRNAADLEMALDKLSAYRELVKKEKARVLQVFEKVFDHQSFTGRSGTFYGFEGLGCIYWHMVSKLLLAVNENYFLGLAGTDDAVQLGRMVQHYYDIRAGIGLNKSPAVFGAFPTDAYSHTPGNGGAKQPGMTGQVKEDIIARFGELGITVSDGTIQFNPGLLRKSELLESTSLYHYISVEKKECSIALDAGSLAFSFCQVPVVYHDADETRIVITGAGGHKKIIEGLTMDHDSSREIFNRTGIINQVDVFLKPRLA